MIDFETEINDYRPSLEVDAIEDAIVRSDLTGKSHHSVLRRGRGRRTAPFSDGL